ncbi:hypothetical protein PGT21_035181 [Puccinia graminis f. sp. tritici]|uniref:CCHC-type domain-containing protein n=1 Tax=Puccinia graminis f. sp. tritici TaxID=56615 RepID=A0A5B0PMZ6_PUCGR|nr:hypothetical protein PGT21_035181 [Puccinia graminis f. sp. tritici]
MPPKRIVSHDDMEDIETFNPSPPHTPTQHNFSHNPSLQQSQHNPANDPHVNGFFQFMSEILSHPEPDGSVIITADKVKVAASLLGVEKLVSTQTLANLEKITSRLDSIEKSIHSPPSAIKRSPVAAWTNAVKDKPIHVLAQPVIRAPPPKKIINEFKPASFVIRKTVPESRPFFQKSPCEITKITNSVLLDIEAKTDDNTPITIKGVATLPSGDFKFFTQSRFAAKWLLEHKHKWTHLCDPALVTPPSSFPVIVHYMPISFTPTNQSSISDLSKENNIDPKDVLSIRWLGDPQSKKQSHGLLIINLFNKDLAQKVEKGGLFYKFLFLRGAHYKKSPLQCFQCLDIGHTAQLCKNPPMCKFCGDNHNSRDCSSDESNDACVKCIQFEKSLNLPNEVDVDNIRFQHSSTSIKSYKFTKPNSNGNVAPLLNNQNILTSNKEEQASLLFKGTSDAPIDCSLSDIHPMTFNSPLSFPQISHPEIDNIISNLPKKKARGHDDIANELIIWAPSTHPIKRLIDSEISNSPPTHPSPIHNILDKHLLNSYDLSTIETIHPHIISPWEDFSLPISNLKTKKEDIKSIVQSQIEQSKSKSEHLIFTDGSNIPENGTGSAAILDNSIQSSFRINSSDKASAFEAEVQAIIIGLDIFINQY